MNTKDIIELSEKYLMSTYARIPIVPDRGEGARLWDIEGKQYLDFVAGLAVVNLGHCHEAVTKALSDQSNKLIHVSNLYHISSQAELARILVENSFAHKVFFSNSGAEANEAAIKLVRRYFKEKGKPERYEIITMERSFHGRTMATLSATAQDKVRRGYDPLLPGFRFVPFNDLKALEKAIAKKTAAVMIEPIQGEGGVNIPDNVYLKGVKETCEKFNLLLIFDEVQAGMGRTGRLFAHENFDTTPHILTLAKALAGGAPIGATLACEDVARAFVPGSHASTFGGNPLVTAAGIANINVLLGKGFLEEVREKGRYLLKGLKTISERFPFIREARGLGLIAALELDREGTKIVDGCREDGLLINLIGGRILRFLPPLVVTREDIDEMLSILEGVMEREGGSD